MYKKRAQKQTQQAKNQTNNNKPHLKTFQNTNAFFVHLISII